MTRNVGIENSRSLAGDKKKGMAVAQGWVEHMFQSVSLLFMPFNDEMLHDKTSAMKDSDSESTTARKMCSSGSSDAGYQWADMTDTDESDPSPSASVHFGQSQREVPFFSTVQTTNTLERSNSLDQIRNDTAVIKMVYRSSVQTGQKLSRSIPEVRTGISDQETLKIAFQASVQKRREEARTWLAERMEPKRQGTVKAIRQSCAPEQAEEGVSAKYKGTEKTNKISEKITCFPRKIFRSS